VPGIKILVRVDMRPSFEVKAVTARVRYYPIGENAKHVLQLTKKKTLSELDV